MPSKHCIRMTLEDFKVYTLVGHKQWDNDVNQNYRVIGSDFVDNVG